MKAPLSVLVGTIPTTRFGNENSDELQVEASSGGGDGESVAKGNASNSGCFGIFGIFLILGIIVSIPAGVWLALGIAVLVGLLTWAEAQQAATELESTASRMVTLIGNCAAEAWQIDESLRQEREEAHTAQQRAELHGQLSAMLYGIEATPGTPESESAAGRVMARVAGYREIKQQITQTREA